MSRPLSDDDARHAVQLYLSGLSCRAVARQTGFGVDAVLGAVRRAGATRDLSAARKNLLSTGYRSFRRDDLPVDQITERYMNGESSTTLAAEFECDQKAIFRAVRDGGGLTRTPAQARVLIDWDATRERGALNVHQNTLKVGWGEDEVYAALCDRGETPDRQHPVGPKNIDIALSPVAVEIWLSSSLPLSDDYCRRRIEYLSDRGWTMLYVLISRRTRLLDAAAVADQVIRFREVTKSNPPTLREHRVIRGSGDLATRFGDDLNPIA